MKILLVEDDSSIRAFLGNLLQKNGYDVETASNGREGLDAFRQTRPDIILTDIIMPDMSGLQMLGKIRKTDDRVIAIVMTGYGTDENAIEALKLKANNFLCKPIRDVDLLALLKKYEKMVQHQSAPKIQLGEVHVKSLVISFKSELDAVPAMATKLVGETENALPKECRLGIHLGLAELLTNAIQHGNLGITYHEKLKAFESEGDAGIERLIRDRTKDPAIAARKVNVDFYMDHERCEWTITDEGPGFNWTLMETPGRETDFSKVDGRGVFLSRLQFDHLEFMDTGNKVRAVKLLNKPL
ncbi:MAG TPA: response regulator [Candidatus Ozemobacteraceae bacterium]|nr:response regulator [Candidatus Ozemobacteraceae bacterium]